MKKGAGIMKYLLSWIKTISFNIFIFKMTLENPQSLNTIARVSGKGNILSYIQNLDFIENSPS